MNESMYSRTDYRLAGLAGLLLTALTTADAQTTTDLGSIPFDPLRNAWPLLVIAGIPLLFVLVRNAARAHAARESERWRSLALTLGGALLTRDRKPTQPAGLRIEIGEWTAIVDEKTEGGEGGSSTFIRFRIPFTATRPLLLILVRLGPLLDRLLHSRSAQNQMASMAAKRGVSPLALVEIGECTVWTSDEPLAHEMAADGAIAHLHRCFQGAAWFLLAVPLESVSGPSLSRLLTTMREDLTPLTGGAWLLELNIESPKASPERLLAARDFLELVMSRLRDSGVAAEGGSPSEVELKPV